MKASKILIFGSLLAASFLASGCVGDLIEITDESIDNGKTTTPVVTSGSDDGAVLAEAPAAGARGGRHQTRQNLSS